VSAEAKTDWSEIWRAIDEATPEPFPLRPEQLQPADVTLDLDQDESPPAPNLKTNGS